jgi:hypothetical protein
MYQIYSVQNNVIYYSIYQIYSVHQTSLQTSIWSEV